MISGGERKHYLSCLGSSGSIAVRLTKTSDTNHENMSLIDDINTMMCGKVKIFDAIAPIRNTNAAGSDEQATAVGQLRHHLELELEHQSAKEPQGVSV